jgi:hypothetical protein
MNRMLTIGTRWPRLNHVEWQAWRSASFLDYQGLVLDLRSAPAIPELPTFLGQMAQYMSIGYPLFVLLPQAKSLSPKGYDIFFLPILHVRAEAGITLSNVVQGDPFFSSYRQVLDRHEVVVDDDPNVSKTIVSNVRKTVCGKYRNAFLLHPPSPGKEKKAAEIIVAYFKPDFEEPEAEAAPDWAQAVAEQLPGLEEARARVSKIQAEISDLERQKNECESRCDEITRWVEMLWLDGIALQERVREALVLIGIPAQTGDPTGHTHDLRAEFGGREFIFEVTGSSGPIGIEKGRQLLQWVLDSKDPATAKGILIANAFRKEPPENRPPNRDQRIFVKELENLATRYHLALVDVREIYALAVKKLEGVDPDVTRLCQGLCLDGVVGLRQS